MSYARHLPVLMYHHVSDKPGQITLSPCTFRAQMKWLAETSSVLSHHARIFFAAGPAARRIAD